MDTNTAWQTLRDYAEGRIGHTYAGSCPDSIEGPAVRDPECLVCQALDDAQGCPTQIEEPAQPVAEICSASHDDAEFGERAIKPLCDISGFEYGTPLYAGAAPAAVAPQGERQWICPTRTVADLVNNLLTLDQALPAYGAQYIEKDGRRCAIAVPPTVSRERVKDGRWIGQGEELNAAVIWTRAEQPAAVAGPVLDVRAIAAAVCQRVAELPDRNSPEDWPEAMLVTGQELIDVVTCELEQAQAAPAVEAPAAKPGGMITVPFDLIAAACSAIDKKRDAPKTLAELRRYTTGDLSRALEAPAAPGDVLDLPSGAAPLGTYRNVDDGATFAWGRCDDGYFLLDQFGWATWPTREGFSRALLRAAAPQTPAQEAPAATIQHHGMTIAGNGAAELGKLMREQWETRGGVYPDGNPNSGQP